MSRRPIQLAATALIACVAAAGITATPAPAPAQQAQSAQSGEGEATQFSDTKLSAYADAVVEVTQVVRKWQPRIRSAQDEENEQAMEKLQQQANAELVAAIQDAEGITLEEYKQISLAARQDEKLYDRLNEMVRARQQAE